MCECLLNFKCVCVSKRVRRELINWSWRKVTSAYCSKFGGGNGGEMLLYTRKPMPAAAAITKTKMLATSQHSSFNKHTGVYEWQKNSFRMQKDHAEPTLYANLNTLRRPSILLTENVEWKKKTVKESSTFDGLYAQLTSRKHTRWNRSHKAIECCGSNSFNIDSRLVRR